MGQWTTGGEGGQKSFAGRPRHCLEHSLEAQRPTRAFLVHTVRAHLPPSSLPISCTHRGVARNSLLRSVVSPLAAPRLLSHPSINARLSEPSHPPLNTDPRMSVSKGTAAAFFLTALSHLVTPSLSSAAGTLPLSNPNHPTTTRAHRPSRRPSVVRRDRPVQWQVLPSLRSRRSDTTGPANPETPLSSATAATPSHAPLYWSRGCPPRARLSTLQLVYLRRVSRFWLLDRRSGCLSNAGGAAERSCLVSLAAKGSATDLVFLVDPAPEAHPFAPDDIATSLSHCGDVPPPVKRRKPAK